MQAGGVNAAPVSRPRVGVATELAVTATPKIFVCRHRVGWGAWLPPPLPRARLPQPPFSPPRALPLPLALLLPRPAPPPAAAFFGFMGVASALVFANLGAAYGTAKAGVGIASMGIMHPTEVMKKIGRAHV